MRKVLLGVLTFAAVACSVEAVRSAEDLEAAVKERRHLMKKVVAPAAKLGGQMVKGVKPFEADKAAEAMLEIRDVPDKYVTLFPQGSEIGEVPDSEALPAIWEEFDDFKALAAKLEETSAKAAEAAGEGKEVFTAAFNGMVKVCKQCHDSYRQKEQ